MGLQSPRTLPEKGCIAGIVGEGLKTTTVGAQPWKLRLYGLGLRVYIYEAGPSHVQHVPYVNPV